MLNYKGIIIKKYILRLIVILHCHIQNQTTSLMLTHSELLTQSAVIQLATIK